MRSKVEYLTEIMRINSRSQDEGIMLTFDTLAETKAAIADFQAIAKMSDWRTRKLAVEMYANNFPNKYVTDFEVYPHGLVYVKTTLYERIDS